MAAVVSSQSLPLFSELALVVEETERDDVERTDDEDYDTDNSAVSDMCEVTQLVPADVERVVLKTVSDIGGGGAAVDLDVPLLEAGVDSLAATELSARLRAAPNVTLSTVRSMNGHRIDRIQTTPYKLSFNFFAPGVQALFRRGRRNR
jgi:hypothetical protein